MLHELEVRDLGIIDRVRLELPGGLTALTGETGAGKSLLVQSLQLLGGERADSEQVRGGCERLLVEGRFASPPGDEIRHLLGDLGAEAGDELVLRREVTAQGRSRAWINDTPVTVGALQRLSPHLLAIHGQHDQRGLADPARHLELVDAAGGLEGLRAEVADAHAKWRAAREELATCRSALASRRDRLDLIAHRLREVDEARVEEGEDETLREERTFLRHAERIGELLASAREALGGEGGTVALARAARAVRELAELGLPSAQEAADLEQARLLGEEAERGLSALADRVRVDPVRLEAVEARLALLERLARKYGGSLAEVVKERSRLLEEQTRLEGAEDDVARLEREEARCAAAFLEVAGRLSARRRASAEAFCHAVVTVLERLAMPAVRLALPLALRRGEDEGLELDGTPVAPGPDGVDVGEFVVSANPGEEPRALARIASGGELSRIHLAMRTVLREAQDAGAGLTLLFDEVDSGIGGRVAEELGGLLAGVARRDQVLVVTHLPPVAARADAQLVVRKEQEAGRTVTRVTRVEGEARVEELVRMLGGGPATPAARRHAQEMLRTP
jgi:DNA repair protein RecN (Recombination protein N)